MNVKPFYEAMVNHFQYDAIYDMMYLDFGSIDCSDLDKMGRPLYEIKFG